MPTEKKSADINQLKRYDVEEKFTKVVNESSSKNAALVAFVADLLRQIQEDNIYVSAEVEKKISELVNKDYRELVLSMLEDDTFISRLSEIVQEQIDKNNKAQVPKKNDTKSSEYDFPSPEELARLITQIMDSNLGDGANVTEEQVEQANKKLEENRKNREEAYKKIIETLSRRSGSATTPSSQPTKTSMSASSKAKATKGKSKSTLGSDFFNPMVASFNFMKDFDTNLVGITAFSFVKLGGLLGRAGKSIVRGETSTIRKLTKAAPKALLTGLFGPFGLIALPVFKLVGVGFKLVGTVFKIGSWAFKTIGKMIGMLFTPVTAIFGKVHKKYTENSKITKILKGLMMVFMTPAGMFALGYMVGSIIKWVKKTFFGKKEETKKEGEELSEEEIEKIKERYNHYALTGYVWDISELFLGKEGAEKLDENLETLGILLFGKEPVDKKIQSNVEKAINKATGKEEKKNFNIVDTAQSLASFFKDTVWPKIMEIKDSILNSKIWNYFKGKDVLPLIMAFAMTVGDVAKYMMDIAPTIMVAIFGKYAVTGAAKATMFVLKTFGGAAVKNTLGKSLLLNPWTWVTVAVLSAGAGLMNGINSIIKSKLSDAERLNQSKENQAEAIRMLSGQKKGNFYDTEVKDAKSKSLYSIGDGGIVKIFDDNYVEANKQIGDLHSKLNVASNSYENISTVDVDRMQEIGGVPPQQPPAPQFDLADYAQKREKEMEKASDEEAELKEEEEEEIESAVKEGIKEFKKPEDAEIEKKTERKASKKVLDKLDSLINIDATSIDRNTVLPDKFDSEAIMAEENKHPLNVPNHVHPNFFKVFRAMFLKNILGMYRSGQINKDKFIDMYNRSINPEDKMYKVYSIDKPADYKFSGLSDADLKRLNGIFDLGYDEKHAAEVLDAAKQVPYYVLFQNYKFKDKKNWFGFTSKTKEQQELEFIHSYATYRMGNDKLNSDGMDKANAELLKLGADELNGKLGYSWWDWNTTSEARLNKVKEIYATRQRRLLTSIGSFEELTKDMDKDDKDYDAYAELQRMYEKFKSSANLIDESVTSEEVKKQAQAFREAFLKKKQELMGERWNGKLEQTLDEQGTINNMEIAKDAGKEGAEATAKAFDEVREKAIEESKQDTKEYVECQEKADALDKESIMLAEENANLDKEIAKKRKELKGKAGEKEDEKDTPPVQGRMSTYKNQAAAEKDSIAVSVRMHHYAMDSKVGDRSGSKPADKKKRRHN